MRQVVFSGKAGMITIWDMSWIYMNVFTQIYLKKKNPYNLISETPDKYPPCIKPNYITHCFWQLGAQGIIFISTFKYSIPPRLRSCTEIQSRLDGGCEACQGFIRMLEISVRACKSTWPCGIFRVMGVDLHSNEANRERAAKGG